MSFYILLEKVIYEHAWVEAVVVGTGVGCARYPRIPNSEVRLSPFSLTCATPVCLAEIMD
jgi:hypothetical protein